MRFKKIFLNQSWLYPNLTFLLLPKEHYQNYWKFTINNIKICLKTNAILSQIYLSSASIFPSQHACIQLHSINKCLNQIALSEMTWWFCLINKLSLTGCLNFFASEARISEWSKSIEQLYPSRWWDTADCFKTLSS